jgi:AcrR family transcriptional regulator
MKRQGDENLNRSESKYFNTAVRMDEALIELLETQEFSYISVKSICEKAGVNRSTFYLHYENTSDLLAETLQYILDSFTSCFQTDAKSTIEKIQDAPIDKLHFLTEDYLVPYLEYIKKNRRIYQAAFENKAYETDKKYSGLYTYILEPILGRFGFAEKDRKYVFYICGITGIVNEWVEDGCKEAVSEMASLIIKVVIGDNANKNTVTMQSQ